MTSCLTKAYKCICCISDPKYPDPYNFEFGSPENLTANEQIFQSNFIKTSKYTWYDFLPKSLLLQFLRVANIFFLVIAILQTIPIISPLGASTAWTPLIIVLSISILRQGYEDFQRYKSDKQQNHEEKAFVFRGKEFVQVEWSQVVVGDLVRVKEKELFPADLILLASSNLDGTAFIETASLDGQKNLKPRNAYPQTQTLTNLDHLSSFSGKWQGIIPDKNTDNFQSVLNFETARILYKKDKQLLWRGTRLMNTHFIYGLAVYTGRNTKIMMNSSQTVNKMSQIQVKVNRLLGFILLTQLICSIICGFFAGFFNRNNSGNNTYIIWSNGPEVDGLLSFFTYFVLVNTMIPISLIVSIEIVKVVQSYFINKDRFMYSRFRKKGTEVKSASLNEELGQIEHIFSDKTGTLTTNRMEFKIACVGTNMYGDLGLISNDPAIPKQQTKGFRDEDFKKMIRAPDSRRNFIKEVSVKNRQGGQKITFDNARSLGIQYLTALSIAHEVVAQQQDGQTVYQGPSPDEITLVEAAKQMGYQFIKSTQATTQINIHGQPKTFELLETFPFTSDRKRMSVVIRDNGMIKMFTKGADSIVKRRLANDQSFNLDSQLTKFSVIGLRTLLVAMRTISDKQYNEFKHKTHNLPEDNKEEALEELIGELQTNLYLIGATAVLDRLQDEVPQTLRDMIRANIKVWMLTGDKLETAENIAKSCNLIQPGFQVLTVRFPYRSPQGIEQSLVELRQKADELSSQQKKLSLLVEGTDLVQITAQDLFQDHFIAIAERCESVVCCRLLPLQKAEVVKMVRTKLDKITLAIGDGANDVPMIKAAHIGIGLFGEEGMSAVQACDYALPQFRMLWRLLLVHGRWNYIRVSEMILYFFYKNMLFTIPQFLFAFYCGFSGQTIFEDWYVAFYNLFFTSLPLVVRAIFEQDINYLTKQKEETGDTTTSNLIARSRMVTPYSHMVPKGYVVNKYIYRMFPKIYYIGQDNCIFNYLNFFLWVAEGALEAVLLFFFSIFIFNKSINSSGYNPDMWVVSLVIYTTVIMIVSLKLATHTKFMSKLLLFSILFLAIGIYVAYMWISSVFPTSGVNHTAMMFFTSAQTYFVVIYGMCLILFIDGFIISLDYDNSGVIKKLRDIVAEDKQYQQSQYDKHSIRFTVGTVVNVMEGRPTV